MKRLFFNISTLSMALLLLISTTGVVVNKHYCMGRLKNVTFFQEVKTCSDDPEMEGSEMSCCTNTTEEFKVEELKKVTFDFDLSIDLKALASTSFLELNLDLVQDPQEEVTYQAYKPPLLNQDIPIVVQSFLL